MSSLRINHQSRAVDASTTSGDTARSGHADDGASFAVALGAAGLAPEGAAMRLGGKTGDDSATPRWRRPRRKGRNPALVRPHRQRLLSPISRDASRRIQAPSRTAV